MKKILLIVGIFCLIIFLIFYYKIFVNGNNISIKNKDKIIEYILNGVSEYEAELEVIVISNKTKNIYNIKQKVKENKSIQEVTSPENIKGLIIEHESNNLKVSNTELNLEKIYKDYDVVLNNSLFLNCFIDDYKNNISKEYEENEEIVLETKLNNNPNTYIKYKELHIDKKTGKPIKLEIKDHTKNTRICIIYNNIEIK